MLRSQGGPVVNVNKDSRSWLGILTRVRAGALLPANPLPMLLLLVSATLNLVLGSQFVGSLLANEEIPEASMDAPAVPELIAKSVKQFSREDAHILLQFVRDNEFRLLPAQAAYDRSLLRAMTIIGQPRPGKEELRAALDDTRQKQIRLDEVVMETLGDALERFSPGARRKIVAQFRSLR
ncbi:MAG: periplasmic heavy metal sensor [Rhizobiales bacterium]|nr:periplasmic heavy metal sensor [Hyphomicrobiales bacterium]